MKAGHWLGVVGIVLGTLVGLQLLGKYNPVNKVPPLFK